MQNISLPQDEDGNITAIPVFLINPNKSPIPAFSQVAIVDANNGLYVQLNTGSSPPVNYAILGSLSSNFVQTFAAPLLWNQSENGGDIQELATSVATGYAANGTTSILAAGGASKKFRLFSIAIAADGNAAADTVSVGDNAGVNNIWSHTMIAAGQPSFGFVINFGPSGILQPNANAAIQVKSTAATTGVSATIVYGAAR